MFEPIAVTDAGELAQFKAMPHESVGKFWPSRLIGNWALNPYRRSNSIPIPNGYFWEDAWTHTPTDRAAQTT